MEPVATILLVDDDEIARYLMRRLLNALCVPGTVRLLEAAHGEQALELLTVQGGMPGRALPLLVLLDLDMPVMNGLQFLEHLRGLPVVVRQAITVMVVSDNTDFAQCRQASELADAFSRKPLKIEVLLELLRHYLPAVLTPDILRR